jgi:hypothetical protein
MVSQVRQIRYRNRDIELPPSGENSVGATLRDRLVAIATGRTPDTRGWLDIF